MGLDIVSYTLGKKKGATTIDALNVTENGTYTAPSGTAYSPVNVNVQSTVIQSLDVTENGTYTAPEGSAYTPINVNVPQTTVESLSVTENGTYTAPSGTAYSPVNVAVPQTTITPLTITANGTYTAPSGTAYSPITANVRNTPSDKLYYQGDECIAATGGWEQLGSSGTVTKNDDYIRLHAGEGSTTYATTHDKVLFDRINEINVRASRSSNSCFEIDLCLFSAKDLSTSPAYTFEIFPYNDGPTTQTIVNIDTSSIDGEYYVALKARNGSYVSGNNCDLFEVTVVTSFDKLYYQGDEYEIATGGWKQFGSNGTITKNADYIYITSGNTTTNYLMTQKKISLDNISAIKIRLLTSGLYNSTYLSLFETNASSASPYASIQLTNSSDTYLTWKTANVSSYTGEYYIAIRVSSSHLNRSTSVYQIDTVASLEKLYYQGDECKFISSGWKKMGANGTVTKNADYMNIQADNSSTCVAVTNRKILLTNLSTINVKLSDQAMFGPVDLQLYETNDGTASPTYTYNLVAYSDYYSSPTVRTADISAVTGEYYVAIKQGTISDQGSKNVNIYEVTTVATA